MQEPKGEGSWHGSCLWFAGPVEPVEPVEPIEPVEPVESQLVQLV